MKSPRAVGIPFCDEQGRYADFHSLRYSWATHLQRQGVNSRMAMKLMRHSDRKLTDKIYTDVNLLPLGETVRNLPAEEPLIHILTHISGKTGQSLSQSVATDQSSETTETSVSVGDRRELSLSDDLESLVEVAGVEPAGGGASTQANKRDEELSVEALTHILTNLADVDRRILSQIVERWSGLSDELKRAVLAVVGEQVDE